MTVRIKTKLSKLDKTIEDGFPEEIKIIREFYFTMEERENERSIEKRDAEK